MATKSKKKVKAPAVYWAIIDDADVEHVWEPDQNQVHELHKDDRKPVRVGPYFYADSGTPIDANGEDMWYSHTEIKIATIDIHVRGGVAYPPENCPSWIKVNIIDHDNH